MGKKTTLILLFLYLIIFISKKTGMYFPELINSYLSDLICIPLVLSVVRWCIIYIKNDLTITLNLYQIALTVAAFGFTFEYYLPLKSSIYTADPFDMMLYIAGGFIYYFSQKDLVITD